MGTPPSFSFNSAAPPGVIEVAVRENNLFDEEAHLIEAGLDAIEVAAGVDDDTPLCCLRPTGRCSSAGTASRGRWRLREHGPSERRAGVCEGVVLLARAAFVVHRPRRACRR